MKKPGKGGKRPSSRSRAPTDVDLIVGQNLRRLRHDHNMTLSDLGAELGISHQQLQKYETGTNRMSAGMLFCVANVFSIPITDIFEGASGIEAEAPDNVVKARKTCHALIARTDSAERLSEIARVLKALSAGGV